MILLTSGRDSAKGFDATLLFAAVLAQRGHRVVLDPGFMPEDVIKHQKYEAAPFLTDLEDVEIDTVLVIAAEDISNEMQLKLRKLKPGPDVRLCALGRFSAQSDQITAQNKLAYAFGRDAMVIDLARQQRRALIADANVPLLTGIAPRPVQMRKGPVRLFVYVPAEMLEEPHVLPDLSALNQTSEVELHIITNAQGKNFIRQSRYASLAVHAYSELPPATLTEYTDIAAFFGEGVPGERMAQYATQAMGMGKVVIDCTIPAGFAANGAPVLRGPEDIVGLGHYLKDVVLDHRIEIGRRVQQGQWLGDHDISGVETAFGLDPTPSDVDPAPPRTVFFPTNGNGLGHAQRCALIAEDLPKDHPVCFAAFPSCVDLLRTRGFDCAPLVQRTDSHSEEYANDLLNYLRLGRMLRRGDQLVFDGGYVFESVYRLISTLQLPSVWIRRGLWQASQVNDTALEREHVFSRVIVPREAFPELNTEYSFGRRIHSVGPVVNEAPVTAEALKSRRKALAKAIGRPFDTLVVSMLGGGVASDRSAHLNMLCSLMEQREKCLHLVVVWPHGVVPQALHGWANTQVVRTRNALALAQAADLTVSAAGYNSFHELLYAQVPTLFIPQSAPYLDDQEKRAAAADDRGLAVTIGDTELLRLRREITACLDEGKADQLRTALKAHVFPAPGNAEAAALIAEGTAP